ncbi:MAG: glycosyltransferase family 39 protein [Candidatus Yanofskybacteria bacterium]|nr:glycosyltransferase family 39 protein [Candidatus Yanofskybacteria bacterium]
MEHLQFSKNKPPHHNKPNLIFATKSQWLVWCGVKNLIRLLAIIIVVASLVLMVTSLWNDSPIVDEIPHIGAGYSYVAAYDFRLNPEHPPLAKDIAGMSLKILDIRDEPAFNSRFWKEDINGQWEFGKKLIFGSGNDADILVRFAKIPELIFFLLAAMIIFVWTRKLYGYPAGLIAVFLFSFSPTVMAHSRFVTTDVPALFGILLGIYFFIRYLKNPSTKNLIIAGLALGIAELTKFSVFLLVPLFLVLAVIYGFLNFSSARWRAKLLNTLYLILNTILIVAIGYIFIVWPVYGLHTLNYPLERQKVDTTYNLGSYGNRFLPDIIIWMSDKPYIRGLAQYGTGLLMVTQRSIGGNDTYFLGEVSNHAWKKYFPIVYFLKEPLAFWGLAALVLISCSIKLKYKKNSFAQCWHHCIDFLKNHFTEVAMLLWLAFYWYASITANLNIGVRHLMPTYGFVFILLAGQISKIYGRIFNKKNLTAYCLLLTALFTWYLYENISVYPYYLTYFNQIAGGPSGGYRYVVDSNLDWGQDLKRLAMWTERNSVNRINLDYFGWADASFYLPNSYQSLWAGKYRNANEFLADNPNGGYIAVSASFFMGSITSPEKSYAWLNDYTPVTVIGNSIFVWHILPLNLIVD